MGWKMVYNSLDKNRENREKMLLTFAKNSIRSKPPPSFRAVYHNKNHVITNTVIMFYKIVYGLVAIQLPSYLEHPMKITRHMHSLSYRQIHTAANYYQFSFFPMSIVLWNRLPKDVVLLSDLDSFKQAVTKITHSFP